jgi:PAS domain S-box-containing protein
MIPQLRVLIVEDELIVAKDIEITLKKLGYIVACCCSTGEEALAYLKGNKADIILMDIQLAGNFDGIQTAMLIQQKQDIPLIFLTSFATDSMVDRAKVLSPYGYILKPFQHGELRTAIETAVYRHAMEHRLREKERLLTTTLQSISDAVITIDRQGLITFMNKVAEQILAKESVLCMGRPVQEIYTAQQVQGPEKTQSILQMAARPAGARTMMLRNQDGKEYFIEDTISPMLDENGIMAGAVLVFRNITDRLESENALRVSEQKYRTVIQSVNEGIIITDTADIVEYCNEQMLHLLECNSLQNIQGTHMTEWIVQTSENDRRRLEERIERRIGGQSEVYLEQIRTRSGRTIWVQISAAPYRNADGQIIGTLGAISDVTERVKAEEELRSSREKYRKLVANAPVGIIRKLLPSGTYEFANQEFIRQAGMSLEEFTQLNQDAFASMTHPDDQQAVEKVVQEWVKEHYQGVKHIQYRVIRNDGTELWTNTYMYADHDTDSDLPTAINVISIDITDLKNAQQALENALREDFRRTVQNLQNLIFKLHKDKDGNYVYALREGKLAGNSTTEIVRGRTPREVFGNTYEISSESNLERAFAGETVMAPYFMDDGRCMLFILEPVIENGQVNEVVGSAVDITEQKRVEQQLIESENRYRILTDLLPIGIAQSTVQGPGGNDIIDYINPELTRQTGYTLHDLQNFSITERLSLIHPDDLQYVTESINSWALSDSNAYLNQTYRFRHKEGYYIWVDNIIAKYTNNGRTHLIQATLDVTERRQADEHMRLLASFPEQTPTPTIEFDRNGNISYVNPAASEQLGIELNAGHHPIIDELLQNSPGIRMSPGSTFRREIAIGDEYFEQYVYFLQDLGTYRAFFYDITERKRGEEELRRALMRERELNVLKSRFVSTVSHEFRTPLTGITMSSELLEIYGDKMNNEQRLAEIAKIKNRVNELVGLMNDFLMQSSVQSMRERFYPAPISLLSVWQKASTELHSMMTDKQQKLIEYIPADLPVLQGDERLLRHIFTNLATNASKYSAPGTEIEFSMQSLPDRIIVKISDQGIGIPSIELTNLFTPFFRASNVGTLPGTGLGLSIVKEFVELHGGTISVHSVENQGTTFTVQFPLTTFHPYQEN